MFEAVNQLIFNMKIRGFLLCIAVYLITFNVFSQTASCANIGFENGDLSGWEGEIGSCCPITTTTSGIVNGRHTIMLGNGTDPYTNDVVKVVAPGSLYSARLGNSNVDAEAERISYTLLVTPENVLFIYKYAVILEDPDHHPSEQPRFQLRVLDENGNLIDPVCAEYTVVAASNIPGFLTNGEIRYKDWTTVGLDLTPYMGDTVKLEFSTGDCSLGAHFGYAYVDASCGPLEISTNYCSNAVVAGLLAPEGFEYLWNTGETTQSINISDPTVGTSYTCILTSVTGCQVEITTILEHQDPTADFELDINCYNNAVFEDTSLIPDAVIIDNYVWDFGDGTSYSGINPTHSYPNPGVYMVSLNISNSSGCISNISKTITVYSPPTASITYSNSIVCGLDDVQIVNLVGTGSYSGGIFSSSIGLDINPINGQIAPNSSISGIYIVEYEIPAFEGCPSSLVNTTIEITPIPIAIINYSSGDLCQNTTIESPTITGTGNYLGGVYSSSSGLSIDSISGIINPSLSGLGTYQINYTTLPIGNCPSLVFNSMITIYETPEFTIDDGFICIDNNGNIIQEYEIQVPLDSNAFSFIWFFNNTEILGYNSNYLVVSQVGNYSVQAINDITQCASELEVSEISAILPFDFTMAFTNSSNLGPTLEIYPEGNGSFLFQLDNGVLQTSNIFPDLDSGIYEITVYDDRFCHQITKRAIVINYPKFFTPNGDGDNDYWNLKNINSITGIKVTVFNRYGKKLTSFRPEQNGWDGTHNGNNLPTDDYWFKVEYNELLDSNNTIVWKEFMGHFTLKR